MTDREILNELLDHCDAFCLMTLVTTVLGSGHDDDLRRDSCYIIDFIGKAYGMPFELIQAAERFILGEMSRIQTRSDCRALASAEKLDESVKENMVLYEIKARAIEEARCTDIPEYPSMSGWIRQTRIDLGYHAVRRPYEPRLRYAQIKRSAQFGEPNTIMQLALMQILGIGCSSDIVSAQWLLQGLLIWGEKAAAMILAYLWGLEGDAKAESFYKSIYDKMDRGVFIPGGEAPEDRFCMLIEAVRTMIIRRTGRRETDLIFAELLYSEELSFCEQLNLIRTYAEGTWMDRLNEKRISVTAGLLSPRS